MFRIALLLPLILVACNTQPPTESTDSTPAPPADKEASAAAPTTAPAVQAVSVEQFQKMKQQHPEYVVLDVRTPAEFASGHIPGAINMDVNAPDFARKMATLDKSKTHLIYCRTGRRSATACQKLATVDIPGYNLTGGITAWQAAGFPTTK